MKIRVDNKIILCKVRWVVKAYLQKASINCDPTFVEIIRFMAFWALFAVAAFYDLDINQMVVKTACF